MAVPNSRSSFINYCLRNLGAPVVQINVDEDQISDRIDEAIHEFQKYHYDAIQHEFTIYQLTADDLTNNYIPISHDIVGIIDVKTPSSANSTDWMTDMGNLRIQTAWDLNFGSGISNTLGNYSMTMDKIDTYNFMFGNAYRWDYHQYAEKLVIHTQLSERFSVGDFILIEVFKVIDADEHILVWSDKWLQNYATALIGKQWGVNLSKYSGVQLPGGISLDGDKIYDRYSTELEKLEEQLANKFTLPPAFIVG